MKNKITFALAFLLAITAHTMIAQDQKFESKPITVSFHSEAPLENIDAINKSAQGIVDNGKQTFFFRVPIKSFSFKSSLMQDHFNENYMESEKSPYAQFKGTLNIKIDFTKEGEQVVTATGELTIHGVVKTVSIPVKINVKGTVSTYVSSFKVKLADYGITIPAMVFNKIAEEVDVKIEGQLVPMK